MAAAVERDTTAEWIEFSFEKKKLGKTRYDDTKRKKTVAQLELVTRRGKTLVSSEKKGTKQNDRKKAPPPSKKKKPKANKKEEEEEEEMKR